MSKRTPEVEAKLIESIASGMTKRAACRLAKIDPSTLQNWEDDPSFSLRLGEAETDRYVKLLALFLRGMERQPGLALKYLQILHPNEFSNRVRLEGPNGGPLQVSAISAMSDEELRALVRAGLASTNGKSAEHN